MLNIFELLSRRAGLPPGVKAGPNKVAPEPSELELLRFVVGMRLEGVFNDLRLVDMLLEKLVEHPDNLDSGRTKIESAIETLNMALEDLKKYKA
jgi:hypothetical protein